MRGLKPLFLWKKDAPWQFSMSTLVRPPPGPLALRAANNQVLKDLWHRGTVFFYTWCTIWGARLSLDFNDSIMVDCVAPVPAAFSWNPLRAPERLETLAAVSFAVTPRGPRLSLTFRWCLVCLYGIWHMALLSQLPNNKNLLFHELGYWSIMIFDTTCTVEDTGRAHGSSCSESGLILAGEVIR